MLLIVVLTSFTLVLIHWVLTSPYGYWKKRNVPHPVPNVLFGNLGALMTLKKNLGQTYKDIYNDYKGFLYVGYYKFRKPAIVIRDMELVKTILVKDFPSFHDNDLHIDLNIDPIFGRNPFVLHGEKWKEIRSLVTSGITSSKVKNMLYLMTNVCKNMVKYLEKNPDANSANGLEAKELTSKYTTDVVASCAFGLEGNCFENKSEFREIGNLFLSPTFWMGIKHMVIFVMPSLSYILRIKFMPEIVQQRFTAIIHEAMKYRSHTEQKRNDYLDMLISLKEKTEGKFTDEDIVAQAATFFGDGFETSSITLSYILYELAEYPDIQKSARQQVDTVLANYNGEITYEAMQDMPYLENIINETLRKHTPVLFITRVCTKPFELPPPKGEGTGPNVTVEIGTPITIPVLAIHYDPSIYKNPHQFDPDRFTEENKQTRPKCSFLAFGEGPRICLGTRFGLAQIKAALIAILSNFEIKPTLKTKRPLEMDSKYFMMSPKGGIWLKFIKRQDVQKS